MIQSILTLCNVYHLLMGIARTRGSPFSCLLRSFSCLLLVRSSDGSPVSCLLVAFPSKMGEIKEYQILYPPYSGIVRYRYQIQLPNRPLPIWQAHVTYIISQDQSSKPRWFKSSPGESRVPVASLLGVPALTINLYKSNVGRMGKR